MVSEIDSTDELLDSERVDSLYAAPLPEFIELRNELAAELKAGNDKEGAALARKLAKPNVVAWAVNQLFYRHREEIEILIDAGELLRGAQQTGKSEVLREATEDRRAAIVALMKIIDGVLEEGGHAATLNTLKKIERTLEAIAVYGRTGLVEPRPGRLLKELEPPGFEVLATLASVPAVPAAGSSSKKNGKTKKKSATRASRERVKQLARDASAEKPKEERPNLAVVRGGKDEKATRSEAKEPSPTPPAIDPGRLRERNRLLRRVKELTTLADKSKTAIGRSDLTRKDSERAFDRRRRNFEAAKKAFEEATKDLEEKQGRVAELETQHTTLTAKLEEVRSELAELEATIAREREGA